MREFNPNLAITPLLLSDLIDEQLTAFRVWSALVLSIAGAALFLALVGLYGVQASLVTRRTREGIAVRFEKLTDKQRNILDSLGCPCP